VEKFKWFISALKNALSVFRKSDPLDSVEAYETFMGTRSAFIAQKSLYGYLKTRMGMKYPKMFDDEQFVESINIAKWKIYAACLSDLAVFMTAQTLAHSGNKDEAMEIGRTLHENCVRSRFYQDEYKGDRDGLIREFSNRLELVDWVHASKFDGAFKTSPEALIKWSPVAEKLKEFDAPLVHNSIKFSWQAKRREFHSLYAHDAFIENWRDNNRINPE